MPIFKQLSRTDRPQAKIQARDCWLQAIVFLEILAERLLHFNRIFFARGYRGSDAYVDLYRGCYVAAQATANWFKCFVDYLRRMFGLSSIMKPRDQRKHVETLIKLNTLKRHDMFFQIEDGAGFRNRGAQILPQDRSAAEVLYAASISCNKSQMALPV